MKHKLESRLPGEISIISDMQMTPLLWKVVTPLLWKVVTPPLREELKRPLIKVKVESEKVGLKINSQKTKIMVSSPITTWQIDGETMKQ